MTDHEPLWVAVDGLVHAETQLTDRGVDLTVAAICDYDGPRRVDFGGGELESAATSARPTHRRDPDDDGWWHLDPGGYPLEHNEQLVEEGLFTLQTRNAVRRRGAFHPTLVINSVDRVPLFVGDGGLRLKENARVSTLLVRSS